MKAHWNYSGTQSRRRQECRALHRMVYRAGQPVVISNGVNLF